VRCDDGVVKHKTLAEIAQILERHKQSGLSLQKFAVQEGIAFSTLQRWARKARMAAAYPIRAKLVEVPNLLTTRPTGAPYCLRFPRGLVLEFVPGFRLEELRALTQLLQSL
jgi:transcriptional regulator with XRE-family HTH domain